MTSYYVTCLSLAVIVTTLLLERAFSSEVELDPNKENVCSYDTYKTVFRHKVVNYTCYKPDDINPPCPAGYWQFPSGYHFFQRHPWNYRFPYWKLTPGRCYRVRNQTCSEDVILVEREVIQKYYCCRGTEPDGAGGCQAIQSPACSYDNGGCDHICKADGTSRICLCRPGYRLVNETRCLDIDECAKSNGGCDHLCTNIPGSFYCTCDSGYELKLDQRTCVDIDECVTSNGECEHNCTNTDGSYYCTCDVGFHLVEGHRCDDDDECSDPIVENGGCSHTCNNVYGDYYCSCPDGYILDERGFNCELAGDVVVGGKEEPLIGSSPKPDLYVIVFVVVGLVLLVAMILLGLYCMRGRLREKLPATIFIIGKKDVEFDADAGAAATDGNKLAATSSDHVYTPPPTGDGAYESPPPYDYIVKNNKLELEDPYEEISSPAAKGEKEQVGAVDNVYVNVSFESDLKAGSGRDDAERYDTC